MTENQDPEIDSTDDVEGHAVTPHGGRPGPGTNVGGRFRPDEDEMFGDDVEGHVGQFRPDEDEMFGNDVDKH